MISPWCSTAMRSAMPNTTSMSCSVNSSVSPRAFTMSRTEAMVSRGLLRRHAGGRLVEQQQARLQASAIASSSCFWLP